MEKRYRKILLINHQNFWKKLFFFVVPPKPSNCDPHPPGRPGILLSPSANAGNFPKSHGPCLWEYNIFPFPFIFLHIFLHIFFVFLSFLHIYSYFLLIFHIILFFLFLSLKACAERERERAREILRITLMGLQKI